MYDPDVNFDQERVEILEKVLGAPVSPLAEAGALVGSWEMRFGGPARSDTVHWLYDFEPEGQVRVEGKSLAPQEIWKWKLNAPGTLLFRKPIAPNPRFASLKHGTIEEEMYWVFTTMDARVVLTNFDSSLIQVLTREGPKQRF